VGALVLAAVPAWFAPVGAATPACVADGDYGQVGGIEMANGARGPFSRGTRSKMYAGGSTPCQRISSIYVLSPHGTGWVEFGWISGYSNCTGTTNSVPRLFYWEQDDASSHTSCRVFSSINPTPGGSATYTVSNIDGNKDSRTWDLVYSSTSVLKGIASDFTRGWPLVGMERGASNDGGYAVWDLLYRYHDSNGWVFWNDPSVYKNEDPGFVYKQYSLHKLASVTK